MRILWVNTHFLHPPTRGAQIRTLEMLRRLHSRHEIHYAGLLFSYDGHEALARSTEYCTRAFPIRHHLHRRASPLFVAEAAANLFSSLPLAIARYRSPAMRRTIEDLIERDRFDRLVCDFLFSAPNIPCLERSVVFEHNVETTIWRRHLENARDPLRRAFFAVQLRRMEAYERRVCRNAGHVIAVSSQDAERIRDMFQASRVSHVPTGVDVDFFAPPGVSPPVADLVFTGSMDWLPNVDGAHWFTREVLPLIRRRIPGCSLAIVGRHPPASVSALARQHGNVVVTGTVPDVRPYLWGSSVAVIPLRIGGGTRLKIFEAMAAGVPLVSTSIGAEGLPLTPQEHLRIADSAGEFAAACIDLLQDASARMRMAAAARELVADCFSWEQVMPCFERILEGSPQLH